MKKEIEIQVPRRVTVVQAKTKVVVRYTCDVCGKDVDKSQDNQYGSGMSACCLCGRDICRRRKTNGVLTCYDNHPDDYGDYPRKMCVICLPLWGELYVPMQERHEKEEEAMEKLIKEKSLGTTC